MVEKTARFFSFTFLFFAIVFFYAPFLFSFKLPIPADSIVGLYSPYRDFYSASYPNGIPFKNFLITDPVRQTYIWKELSIDVIKSGHLPLWNPYEMAGKPLISNFQSGVFYPLNLIFFVLPFAFSWSVFIMMQTVLGGIFTFWYLRNLKINAYASLLGSLSILFSGFSISWLEWGTVISTSLWLPLLLLSIDKIFHNAKPHKISRKWFIVYTFALISSFFAGHLQTFFYLFLICTFYFIFRLRENKGHKKTLVAFLVANVVFIVVTVVQWVPTLQFINLSARELDQNYRTVEGWFIPWKHLIQFVSPDFFGNPVTLNYWGTWNYGELVGFIGVLPLLFSFFSFFKKNSTVVFFLSVALISLLFALPTGISKVPYVYNLPFLSSAQPTRLIFLVSFSLSVLASFGFDTIINYKKVSRKFLIPPFVVGAVFILLWVAVITNSPVLFGSAAEALTAKRNLIFPSAIFMVGIILLFLLFRLKSERLRQGVIILIVIVAFFDLLRFAQKFTPFTNPSYLYPNTHSIDFLKEQKGAFRIAVMDRRIMPPNFFTHYKLQTIEGYDPLYLRSYAEYITAMERGKPNITQPFGFNRIITPHNLNSSLFDLLNVVYVLSFDELKDPKLLKVFEEGQVKIYKNINAFPRAFFVQRVVGEVNDISGLFENDLKTTAVVLDQSIPQENLSIGTVAITKYGENKVELATSNTGDGFLVLTDTFYPTWSVFIDGVKSTIYPTDHIFRGVYVPKGNHVILFKDSLF